jgi:hypothetical protein
MAYPGTCFSLRSIVSACVCASAAFITAASAWLSRVVDAVFRCVADPLQRMLIPPLASVTGPDLHAYDGPTIDLRHEAARRRLAAARNI